MPCATLPAAPFDPSDLPVPAAQRIELHLPAAWMGPAHPQAAAMQATLERWFRELGVIRDGATFDRFCRMDVAGYGGLPFALARPEALEVCAAMLSLWIFHDDEIEGLGDDDEARLLAALRGDAGPQGEERPNDSPCLRGFRALGRRFAARMSPAWMARHAADFERWLASVRQEALLLARFRAGRVVGVEEHMAVRRWNVGLVPVLDWIEFDLGQELPERLRQHPAMAILVEAACRAVAFANELFGYTKDRQARFINAVACAEREDRQGTAAAFARIAALHDQAIAELTLAGAGLLRDPALGSDRPLARAWLVRLRRIVAGFAAWHAAAPRYAAVHDDASGSARLTLRLAAA